MWFHVDNNEGSDTIVKYSLKTLEDYELKDGSVLVLEIKQKATKESAGDGVHAGSGASAGNGAKKSAAPKKKKEPKEPANI
jgi:hypothetical protein